MASAAVSPSWPQVSWESLPWERDYDPYISRTQARRYSGPYSAAIPASIAEAVARLQPGTIAEADDATAEIVRFDAEAGQITAPFSSMLLRTESASSSQIENLTAGARQLGLAELGASDSVNAQLVVSNVRAMQAALALSDRIDADAIIDMHRELLVASRPDIVGRWRSEAVWIGGGSLGPHTASFVPPDHTRVPAAIDDLLRFIRRDDVGALPAVALAHAQFETIHPFVDGNGRTGRALVQSIFRHRGITRNVTVPVSSGLLGDTAGYFDALNAYREGDADAIVRAFSEASHAAVANGRELVANLTAIREEWSTALAGLRSDAGARTLASHVFEQPVLDAAAAGAVLRTSPTAIYRALDLLVERGILAAASENKRNRFWIASSILDALDAFAARAKRRR